MASLGFPSHVTDDFPSNCSGQIFMVRTENNRYMFISRMQEIVLGYWILLIPESINNIYDITFDCAKIFNR